MKNNPSQEQLTKSLDRRTKHLMIRVLEKFEDSFPGLEDSRDGQIFKGDLKNAFNDVMRAQRDELRDYEVDYRPLRFNDDNVLAITQTFIQTVQKVEFGFIQNIPFLRIYTVSEYAKELDAIRAEMDVGVIYKNEDRLILEIVGLTECVYSVLPRLDRYHLHIKVESSYREWREHVVKLYTRK